MMMFFHTLYDLIHSGSSDYLKKPHSITGSSGQPTVNTTVMNKYIPMVRRVQHIISFRMVFIML